MFNDKSLRILMQGQNDNRKMIPPSSNYFVETLSIKMDNLNPLVTLSMKDQEVFQTSLEKFVQENDSDFFDLEARFICQMREKVRNDRKIDGDTNGNILVILALSGNYNGGKKRMQKNVRQDLQKVLKDNYEFMKNIHEQSDNDPFYYLSNIGDIEVVKTPKGFEAYERQASSSYGAMLDKNYLISNENNNEEKTYGSLGSSAIIGASVFSVGVLLLVSSLFVFRKNRNSISRNNSIENKKSVQITTLSSTSNNARSSNQPQQVIIQKEGKISNELNATHVRSECTGPPGKLGVSIYPVDGVPVVYKVKTDSPLHGTLFHKDRIVGIDEIDTTLMTAADVTKVIVSRMKMHRTITYVRSVEN